jgi:hypothetical protein
MCSAIADFHGGGICVEAKLQALYLAGQTTLVQNHAAVTGGALASFGSEIWTVIQGSLIHITGNTAQRGSALYYRGVPTGSTTPLEMLVVADNTATVGGTVFWLHDYTAMPAEPGNLLW